MECPNCKGEVAVCVVGDPTIKNTCTCPHCKKDFDVQVKPKAEVKANQFVTNPGVPK